MAADRNSADHRRLAGRALLLLAGLAVPTAVVAGLVAGVAGVVGALIGLGFVALLFGAASLSLAWAVEHAPSMTLVVLAAGTFTRLATYAAVLDALSDVTWVHPPSLALATGVATALTLAAELVWLARTPQLFHVDLDVDAPRPAAVPHETTTSSEHVPAGTDPEPVPTGSRSL
ncbi:MAG: hypothetical protein WEB09_07705 [Nitriliruptor sp.]